MSHCIFPDGPPYQPGTHVCSVCGRKVPIRAETPRIVAPCKDEQQAKAPKPEPDQQPDYASDADRRHAICLACDDLIRTSGQVGCKHFKQCNRVALWEAALRVGACPKGKWGFAENRQKYMQGKANPKFFVIGAPGHVGGACTELWHTIRLWTENNATPHIIPTWGTSDEWRDRMEGQGCVVHNASADTLAEVPGLAGSTVVSMCNDQFLTHASKLREMGCRLVWLNCMCWLFPKEISFVKEHGPFDLWVCQSMHQLEQLWQKLKPLGVPRDRMCHIPGAFAPDEFPYAPRAHAKNTEFYMGRLCREDPDKWSSNLLSIYNRCQHPRRRARLMGWNDKVQLKCGAPPAWAETLPANKESAQAFLSSLHALVPINGGAQENWPRVGLEAMAAGVPVVTQNSWGWREMFEHGKSGLLCSTDEEFGYWLSKLAHEEDFRQEIIKGARKRLDEIAGSAVLWPKWKEALAVA